jgi:hypothetical protein
MRMLVRRGRIQLKLDILSRTFYDQAISLSSQTTEYLFVACDRKFLPGETATTLFMYFRAHNRTAIERFLRYV